MPGLTLAALKELRYGSIAEVETDIEKLRGTYRVDAEVPELAPFGSSDLQASTLGRTAYTERFASLIGEPLLRRLAGVSQLGPLNLVYPTCSHTRRDHVLGSYTNAAHYIYALYHDPINPFFRHVMTAGDLCAALVAALLHDLGQYPLAHDLEEAARSVFSHEVLTTSLLKGERLDLQPLTDSLAKRLSDWGVKPERVLSILTSKPGQLERPLKDRLLHCIISGPIDADKLDYLVRDGRQCQVPYAQVIDFQRLLKTLTVVYEREKGDKQYIAIGIHAKGQVAAECVAFARYAMFSQVYWHHASRSAKTMLHHAVWEWFEVDKRNNDQKKTECHQFVLGREHIEQPTLFEPPRPKTEVGHERHPEWSQIHPADRAMLAWIHEHTTEIGKRLIQMLATRQLYKRLAIISSQEGRLWKDLQRVCAVWLRCPLPFQGRSASA